MYVYAAFKATWSVRDFLFLLQNHVIRDKLHLSHIYVKTVKICFVYHLGVEIRRSKGCLTLFTRRPRGVFETVVGVAKCPEGNA